MKIFIEIMQVGASVAIMQMVFSAVHYAHEYFYCNYAGGCFRCSNVTASSSNFIFLSSDWHWQKTFKGIISSLHFTTLINILPKLRYFVGRIYIQIGSFSTFVFPIGLQKVWHLGFLERGNIRKGWVDLEKRGVWPAWPIMPLWIISKSTEFNRTLSEETDNF